jgi:hypothetical protein
MNAIPYLVAIGIPVVFLIMSGLSKKIIRGRGWDRKDFYLGIESTLAAISTQLVYIFDIVKLGNSPSGLTKDLLEKLTYTSLFFALSILVLMAVLIIHQEWDNRNNNRTGQIVMLIVINNLLGAGLLIGFILAIKGI